mgnify:CR=1 FL=1
MPYPEIMNSSRYYALVVGQCGRISWERKSERQSRHQEMKVIYTQIERVENVMTCEPSLMRGIERL